MPLKRHSSLLLSANTQVNGRTCSSCSSLLLDPETSWRQSRAWAPIHVDQLFNDSELELRQPAYKMTLLPVSRNSLQ